MTSEKHGFHSPLRLLIRTLLFVPILLVTVQCSKTYEKLIMFYIHQTYHEEILATVQDSPIEPSYVAALISLESNPPGNVQSERFEPAIYDRLVEARDGGRSFGRIPRRRIIHLTDTELKHLASSYGLTQIMGYHCLQLGCKISDLKGKDHLKWAVKYMKLHYGKQAKEGNWADCFRIHNTGHPSGKTARVDYVRRGLARMEDYQAWDRVNGKLFPEILRH